jgi:hypothetical protein
MISSGSSFVCALTLTLKKLHKTVKKNKLKTHTQGSDDAGDGDDDGDVVSIQ